MNTVNVVSDWLLSAELAPDVENDPLRPLYEAAARGELALPFCVSCALPLELVNSAGASSVRSRTGPQLFPRDVLARV